MKNLILYYYKRSEYLVFSRCGYQLKRYRNIFVLKSLNLDVMRGFNRGFRGFAVI